MRRAAAIALAIGLLRVPAAAAEPAAPLLDEASAECARALAEMRPPGRPWRVAVSAPAVVAARLVARLPRSAGLEVVRLAPGTTLAAVQSRGFDLWIDADLRVDDAEAGLTVRLARTSLGWREWLATPMRGWVRSFRATRPLDAALRRALHVGPRELARPARLDLDLGAPLLALAAADVDGDGRAELIALTTDEVVLLQAKKDTLVARQRVALAGAAPVPRPREPLGAMVAGDLDGDGAIEIFAASSEHAQGLRLSWQGGALVPAGSFAGFPVCLRTLASPPELGTLALVPGRNVFASEDVAAACAGAASGAVHADGRFVLGVNGAALATVPGVGTAIALADLDGTGVELIASAYRAPGDGDQLTVYAFPASDLARAVVRWKSDALSGGIVAVTTGDTDGDGAVDIVYAARLVGATRTDVWIVR